MSRDMLGVTIYLLYWHQIPLKAKHQQQTQYLLPIIITVLLSKWQKYIQTIRSPSLKQHQVIPSGCFINVSRKLQWPDLHPVVVLLNNYHTWFYWPIITHGFIDHWGCIGTCIELNLHSTNILHKYKHKYRNQTTNMLVTTNQSPLLSWRQNSCISGLCCATCYYKAV